MIVIFLLILMMFAIWIIPEYADKTPDNFPPGPPSVIPVYNAQLLVMAKGFQNLPRAFKRLADQYKTKIVGLYYGPYLTIVIDDPQLLKEMVSRPEFDGRPDVFVARLRSYWKKFGIVFTDGDFWLEQKRFSFRHLRDYESGKRKQSLEAVIKSAVRDLIHLGITGPKFIGENEIMHEDLILLPHFFAVPFISGMIHVMTQKIVMRYEYRYLWDLARHLLRFQRGTDTLGGVISLTPRIKDYFPNWSGYNQLVEGSNYMLNFANKLVTEAMANRDELVCRHFVDFYIKMMKEEQKTGNPTTFSDDQLVMTLIDFLFPASTGVEMVLTLMVERMLMQPDLQDKVHEEIDRVVGRNRSPTLADRDNMPFIEAFIRETMRYDTLVPLGIAHRTVQNTEIGGYRIPENTIVAANYVTLHMSKEIWGDPENFRPERFIKNGKIDLASDKFLPFGAGRRVCPGETFARQSMFLVFSGFMQIFHVSTADGKPLKKPAKRIQGIITTMPEFWVKVKPRGHIDVKPFFVNNEICLLL